MNMYSDVFDSHSYRKQLCEQSRRFNSVGVMCVTSPSDLAYDDDDCDYLRAGGVTTSTVTEPVWEVTEHQFGILRQNDTIYRMDSRIILAVQLLER